MEGALYHRRPWAQRAVACEPVCPISFFEVPLQREKDAEAPDVCHGSRDGRASNGTPYGHV